MSNQTFEAALRPATWEATEETLSEYLSQGRSNSDLRILSQACTGGGAPMQIRNGFSMMSVAGKGDPTSGLIATLGYVVNYCDVVPDEEKKHAIKDLG